MLISLDAFIPIPDVRERHSIAIQAPASAVWAIAETFDFQSVSVVRAIIRLRQLLLRSSRVQRTPQPFLQEAVAMGWGVLARVPGRLFMAGAQCQPWLADVTFTPVSAAEFAAWQEPNRVKVAWTLEVQLLGPTSARLITETRAVATDLAARRRFRRYWWWARFGIVAIRWLMLPAIRRRAEAAWRAESTA